MPRPRLARLRRGLGAMVPAVALVGACSGDSRDSSVTTTSTTAPGASARPSDTACSLLRGQADQVRAEPVDLIGLDRAAVGDVLHRREQRLRALAAVTGEDGRPFAELADLYAVGRPLVVERWGDRGGDDLHARAMRDRTFFVVNQALLEAGRQDDEARLSEATDQARWARFRLATRCEGVADIPTGSPEALGAHGLTTPLLALDLRENTLTRVEADGGHAHLRADGSRIGFPLLSPDRRRVAAQVSDEEDERASVGVVGLDGEVQARVGTADCGGWLPDGTLVVGTAAGDAMELTTPSSPGRRLPVSGGDCPRPGRGPDEVLVQRGRIEREDAFVVAQALHDGRVRQEFRLDGCGVVSPVASPVRTEVAFAASCDEPLRSGIWVADASGGLHHVLACVCGVPAFSPDGGWLAAVVVPTDRIGRRNTERLAFVRRDGSGAFRLPFGALSFPMWPAP